MIDFNPTKPEKGWGLGLRVLWGGVIFTHGKFKFFTSKRLKK